MSVQATGPIGFGNFTFGEKCFVIGYTLDETMLRRCDILINVKINRVIASMCTGVIVVEARVEFDEA